MTVFERAAPKTLLLGILPFAIFSLAFVLHLHHPVAPSDPLQYLSHAVGLEQTANFLDRVLYLFTLRVFSDLLPFVDATASLSYVLTILIALLGARISRLLGCSAGFSILLSLLLLSSHGLVAISAYGYPTQYQAVWILLALMLLLDEDGPDYRYQILGIVLVMAVFTKIQSLALVALIFALVVGQRNLNALGRLVLGGVGGILILAGLDVMIADVDIRTIFSSYFGGEVHVQMGGRKAGGVPPFFVLLLDPSYALAALGLCLASFGPATDRGLRLLGLMGVANFAFILFIYIVTQRGGPVILNYLLDTYVIGLICAVCYGARLLKKDPSGPVWALVFALFALMLLGAPYMIEQAHSFLSDLDDSRWALGRFVLVGMVFWAGIVLFALKWRATWIGVLLILCLAYSSLGGIREAAFRKSFADTFNTLARLPAENPDTALCYSFGPKTEKFRSRLPALSEYRDLRAGETGTYSWPDCDAAAEAETGATKIRVWRDTAGFHLADENGSI